MNTPVYTTKKLERVAKRLIQPKRELEVGILGKWNATVFHIDRKKCWFFTNSLTQYNVILWDIKAKDFGNIEEIFKNTFYGQLIYNGILIDYDKLDTIIGDMVFFPTDGDKKTIGFQNHRLADFDWWKLDFGSLENMPKMELAKRTNDVPIHVGKSKKMSDFTKGIKEMRKVLLK